MPPPEVISGGIRPLLETNTARPLRYSPEAGAFVIRNGRELFNRPVYGPVSDFRIDASDVPEFSLYLPGHGGNLKLGWIAGTAAKWTAQADEVLARYVPGRMIYEIRDLQLGGAVLRMELLTASEGTGLLLKVESHDLAAGVRLAWGFAAADGDKGRRRGDIGCEVKPVAEFFRATAAKCHGNRYTLSANQAKLQSGIADLQLTFPPSSELRIADFNAWDQPPGLGAGSAETDSPVLMGSVALGTAPLYLSIQRDGTTQPEVATDAAFEERSQAVTRTAAKLQLAGSDPFLTPAAPALCTAADALWDEKLGCVMHGAVAWRNPLAGWRGPYVFDVIGDHDRTRKHLRHWLARQNTQPVTTGDPATGPYDPGQRHARKESMLHSNGDLSGNHYDMNLVFFDVLLRHLRWTGDMTFAREVWPALQRQLAWEHRLFRRTFSSADGTELPLYEAYAAIWASDNLQYSGGGTAHASAYNLFALRIAAQLAKELGENGSAYAEEAALLERGMKELLWLPQQGAYAEAKDLLGPQTVYSNPALWTVYHTVDSEVPTLRQAWQMLAERLYTLRKVPVSGAGVPEGNYMLSCSDWLPYQWSLNLLILAEDSHMALAMWQAGMREEAFKLLKGNLLDSMYQGLCPGDFHMSSELDVHRQEAQRDFGDPIGITSRALMEGLFGVRPDLIAGEIVLQPGFPSSWTHASMQHTDFDLQWTREGLSESIRFTGRFPGAPKVKLRLPAHTTQLPKVTGADVQFAFDVQAVGRPIIEAALPATFALELHWSGNAPTQAPEYRTYRLGEKIALPAAMTVDDPQHCLREGSAAVAGVHTVFVEMHEGEARWAMPVSFTVQHGAPQFLPVPHAAPNAKLEPVDLAGVLDSQLTSIFTRLYVEPRSPFCSLAIPDTLLGGWAEEGAPLPIDDSGLRSAGGLLKTGIGVPFGTPAGNAANCVFLSYFEPDEPRVSVALSGKARGLYLLMTGTTLPQCSRMENAAAHVIYADGSQTTLSLRNPETWWPIEQDYLLDDYLFVNEAPLPPRIEMSSGKTRLLDPTTFKGRGRRTPGGSATVYHLALDPAKSLKELAVEVKLYGIVVALLGATLDRS